jgi:hypothetical protein
VEGSLVRVAVLAGTVSPVAARVAREEGQEVDAQVEDAGCGEQLAEPEEPWVAVSRRNRLAPSVGGGWFVPPRKKRGARGHLGERDRRQPALGWVSRQLGWQCSEEPGRPSRRAMLCWRARGGGNATVRAGQPSAQEGADRGYECLFPR